MHEDGCLKMLLEADERDYVDLVRKYRHGHP